MATFLRRATRGLARAAAQPMRHTVAPTTAVMQARTYADSVTVQLPEYHTYEIDAPASEVTVTKDQLMQYYNDMTTVRTMEVAAHKAYGEKKIRGFLHLYIGQESVAVGTEHAITKDDLMITAYRCHGNQYMRGDSVESILAELMGKSTGNSRGKGGSMHMYYDNFFGGNGIVGAQVPLGAGLAFALKYREQPNVSVSFYGDGAANQGQLYEAYNMAALWKLPAIFVVENNGVAMGTTVSRSSASTEYYKRAPYVPGIRADGFNILSVIETMRHAKEHCVAGKGPVIVELMTYRYQGHSMSDPGLSYRTKDEVKEVRETKDCIQQVGQMMIDNDMTTPEELKAIDKAIRKDVNKAVKAAEAAKPLPANELATDVYYKDTDFFLRHVSLPKSGHADDVLARSV